MFNLNKKKKIVDTENITEDLSLDKKIEAILFFKGEEISLKFLAKILDEKKGRVKESLEILKKRLETSGLTLVENNDLYLLTTRLSLASLIQSLVKEEELSELSKPALETIAIILYKAPISKVALDEIRGINSSYILRNLLIRGLIEKEKRENKNFYRPTLDLLRFIGVKNQQSLPAYKDVLEKIKKIEENNLQGNNLV